MADPMFDPMADPRKETRWTAVLRRDPGPAGEFIYAVKTTGIYCRPGCSSRTPARKNVEFFENPAEARSAGYRPCRRCHPDDENAGDSRRERDLRIVTATCRRLEESGAEPPLNTLAGDAGMSPGHFHRLFKAVTGVTPHEYASSARSERFLKAVVGTDSVTRAVYEAGYSSPSRAYEEFRGRSVLTPTEHRRGAPEVILEFAVEPCRLGWVIVAVSDKGLCAVLFDDKPDRLPGMLAMSFPKAELREIGAAESILIRDALAGLEGQAPGNELPLDIIGTAFQKKVWKALREIPPGRTAGYGEIAERIGAPGASRAVANACGANKIGYFIPCHRIIRSDGGIGGYRWGTDRKRRLLKEEGRETR